MTERDRLLRACRVPSSLVAQERLPWRIRRTSIAEVIGEYPDLADRYGIWTEGDHVTLERWTLDTLMSHRGEIVMEDSRRELARHLPILLRARGRVLISGLGLGCVVRGLLAKSEVTHIDVVEIDARILAMVGPEFEHHPRVTLHHGNAETYAGWGAGACWDWAWHDVWSEDESLDLVHARLLARYAERVTMQGAWQLPRWFRRIWPGRLLTA